MARPALLVACLAALVTLALSDKDEDTTGKTDTDLSHSETLDADGNYKLFWSFDEEWITFEVRVKTSGWVGFGLTDNGRMLGADMVVGWVKDGGTVFQDRYGVGNTRPALDDSRDYVLLASGQQDGVTRLRFTRKLVTCDAQDYRIHGGTVRVIYAWGNDDPDSPESFSYHGATQRGAKSVIFLNADQQIFNPDGYLHHDMLMDEFEIPATDTHYHCRRFQLPKLDGKHHIINISPIIQKGNVGVVHHMVVVNCQEGLTGPVEGPCNMEDYVRNSSYKLCVKAQVYAWAIGQGDFSLPKEAGIPFGGESASTWQIQFHYDNPRKLSGIKDSSGIRIYYTSKTRQYDVGLLSLGEALLPRAPSPGIPAGQPSFLQHSYCGSQCTKRIPTAGIKVFASMLHAHTAGVGIWTDHMRAGHRQPSLGSDRHYDFNYQALRTFTEVRTIRPGDEMRLTCEYNTMGRTEPTYGGFGTRDEMCINFMYYYPAMDQLTVCNSKVIGNNGFYQVCSAGGMDGFPPYRDTKFDVGKEPADGVCGTIPSEGISKGSRNYGATPLAVLVIAGALHVLKWPFMM